MSRNLALYLEDALTAIAKIHAYTEKQTLETLLGDPLRTDALILNLLIIGEAVGRIPDEWRAAHPQIPWRQVVGLRNVIAHQYFDLDVEIIWDVVTRELPSLQDVLRQMVAADQR